MTHEKKVAIVGELFACSVVFALLLTIGFVVFRFNGNISWPWVWVFSPLWIEVAILVTLLALAIGIDLFCIVVKWWLRKG